MITFSSKLIDNAVHHLSKLPGIGKKSALRLVLHLLKEESTEVEGLANSLIKLRTEINYCTICHYVSETDICEICSNTNRDHSIICVVEDMRDLIAIENTCQYNGAYHILGGVISPINGIGPANINFETLLERIKKDKPKEIVMALSPTIEGDTTMFFLYKKLKMYNINFTTISRGVSMGEELENADEITLGRAIINRTQYDKINVNN